MCSCDVETRREAVRLFSECKLSAWEAVRMANFKCYGELLDALGEFGFRKPCSLPEEELERMANLVAHVIRNHGCLEMDYGC